MGIFNGFLSHPAEVSLKQISLEYGLILVDDEYVEKAYKVNRDKFILTNKRVLLIVPCKSDKMEYMSIPYSSIRKFSKEGTDIMDKNAKLKIWLRDETLPIIKEFKNCDGINGIYQILSKYVL